MVLIFQCALLKYWTARSCFSAAARVLNVPRFFRFPVLESFFFEYNRYSPLCNFRIIQLPTIATKGTAGSLRFIPPARLAAVSGSGWRVIWEQLRRRECRAVARSKKQLISAFSMCRPFFHWLPARNLSKSAALTGLCSNPVLSPAHRRVHRSGQDMRSPSCGAGTLRTQDDSWSPGFVQTSSRSRETRPEGKVCSEGLSIGCSQIE